ncbi:MAG TPA: hypothetical protein VLV78_05130 [Thermoanaerobaculia bacterium]|nr:hypothetical protein [Thermoanaerobaculia bacterium]
MRVAPRAIGWLVLTLIFLASGIASASVAPPDARQELKKQFAVFFAQVDEKSLEAFGAMKQSPETLKAIEKQVDAMSDEQVAKLRQTIGEFPTPGAITEMFPPKARDAMKKMAADAADLAPRAGQMRDDVLALTRLLKSVPDAKLRELGVDRAKLDLIERAFTQISPLEATQVQKQLAGNAEWQSKSATALATMPPALRRGAAALAKHGPISSEEALELEKFRSELVAQLQRIDALPAEMRKDLSIENLGLKMGEIATATPDALFMIRYEVTSEKMRLLDENIALLERVSRLAPRDIDELNRFRRELSDAFGQVQPDRAKAQELETNLAALDARELLLLRERMGPSAEMTVALPAVYRTISAPGFADRVVALQQPAPNPDAVRQLEEFRANALLYIASAQVQPELAARAKNVVEKASLPQLEFIRGLNANLPEQASAQTRLKTVAAVDIDCRWCIDLWVTGACIDINWICTPFEAAINAVDGAIRTAVDTAIATLTGVINTVDTTLRNIIMQVVSGVDLLTATVNSLVTGIITTVTDIWNAVQTVGNAVWQAWSTAVEAFLDIEFPGVGFSMLDVLNAMDRNRIHEGLAMLRSGLMHEDWTRLENQPLPDILCPANGFATSFGPVGTREAAKKAERYQYFLDELVELVPDTEISLALKYYMMQVLEDWKVLATCLKQASEDTQLNTILVTSNDNRSLLATQLTNSFNSMTGQTMTLSALITTKTDGLQTAVGAIQTSVNEVKANLTDATDASHNLALRLQIETNLSGKDPLAMFQLPKANGGYLELARDIVNGAISAMLAAGQSVGQASRYYNEAAAAMNLGKYKEAYNGFQNAYQELRKFN